MCAPLIQELFKNNMTFGSTPMTTINQIGLWYYKKILVMCVLCLIPISASYGQEILDAAVNDTMPQGSVINLEQSIRIALANNAEIKRSMLSIKDADQQVVQAWGGYLPEVSGTMSYARNLQIPIIFFPDFRDPSGPLVATPVGSENQWQGIIDASQVIFDGETIVGITSADLFKTAQKENLRATAQQVVTDTRKAYHNVLVAKQNLQLREASINRIKENLDENRARYREGLIDEFQVLQLEVQLSNEQPLLTEARYRLEQAYRQLSITMGLPIEWDYKVKGDLLSFDVLAAKADTPDNINLKKVNRVAPLKLEQQSNELFAVASERRGDLRVLDFDEKLNEKEIMREKSLLFPSLTANYQMNWSAQDPGSPNFFGSNSQQRNRTQALTFTLNVPIFQRLERSTELSRRLIEKKDINQQQELALKQAKHEIITAQENIKRIYETAEARKAAIEQARRSYEIALARFNRGVGSQLDVTNAELQLRQAETNYAEMVHEYLNAKADYDLATGIIPFVDN